MFSFDDVIMWHDEITIVIIYSFHNKSILCIIVNRGNVSLFWRILANWQVPKQCFGTCQLCQYHSGLLHWRQGNFTIASMSLKQHKPWWVIMNSPMNHNITTTKPNKLTSRCRYKMADIWQTTFSNWFYPWWRHQMETFSALLAICAGNSPLTGEFPAQRPVMRSFDAFFDLRLIEPLSKQFWGWWFETPSCPLWRHIMSYRNCCITEVCSQGSNKKYGNIISNNGRIVGKPLFETIIVWYTDAYTRHSASMS